MKHLLTLLFITMVCLTTHADDTNVIEGAFGVKFGNPCTNTVGRPSAALPNEWILMPQVPNAAFNEYRVFLTPKSHVVYKIKALRPKDRMEDAEFQAVCEVLWKKYEKREDDIVSGGLLIITRNKRQVVLHQKGFEDRPTIEYGDIKLYELGQKESAQLETDPNKKDPSGF